LFVAEQKKLIFDFYVVISCIVGFDINIKMKVKASHFF